LWCHYCDKNNHKTYDCRAIAKFKQQKKNKACFEAKAGPGKKSLTFLVEKLMHSKGSCNRSLKRLSSKKRKAESILSTKINLTTSSDESENKEHFFTSSDSLSTIKTKLEKSSHPTTNNQSLSW
jgi:hypothetical protein